MSTLFESDQSFRLPITRPLLLVEAANILGEIPRKNTFSYITSFLLSPMRHAINARIQIFDSVDQRWDCISIRVILFRP